MVCEDEERLALEEELTDEEIDQVAGGIAVFTKSDSSLHIEWAPGHRMRDLWAELEKYATLLRDWGHDIEEVRALIRVRAKEKVGGDFYYHATTYAAIYLYANGTIR